MLTFTKLKTVRLSKGRLRDAMITRTAALLESNSLTFNCQNKGLKRMFSQRAVDGDESLYKLVSGITRPKIETRSREWFCLLTFRRSPWI
jgi:hypothetical protein